MATNIIPKMAGSGINPLSAVLDIFASFLL
jgi:hypothetical protein